MNEEELQLYRLRMVAQFFARARAIFKRRNRSYGDAIRVGGYMGAMITLIGDAARLHNLSLQPTLDEAAIRDTLTDIANYASIANMMLAEGNIWGGFNAPIPEGDENGI